MIKCRCNFQLQSKWKEIWHSDTLHFLAVISRFSPSGSGRSVAFTPFTPNERRTVVTQRIWWPAVAWELNYGPSVISWVNFEHILRFLGLTKWDAINVLTQNSQRLWQIVQTLFRVSSICGKGFELKFWGIPVACWLLLYSVAGKDLGRCFHNS